MFTVKEVDRIAELIPIFSKIEKDESASFFKKKQKKENISVTKILKDFLDLSQHSEAYRVFIKKLVNVGIFYENGFGLRMNIDNACYLIEYYADKEIDRCQEIKRIVNARKDVLTSQYSNLDENMIEFVKNIENNIK